MLQMSSDDEPDVYFSFSKLFFSLDHFSYDDFELRSFYESKIQYYIKHTLTCDLITVEKQYLELSNQDSQKLIYETINQTKKTNKSV